MKIRMLDCEAHDGVYLRAGEEHDVPDAVGKKWLEIGLAESLDAPAVVASGNTVAPPARARRRSLREE